MNFSIFVFGITVGLLIAAFYALSQLTRYVSSDVDSFVKWLDKADTA